MSVRDAMLLAANIPYWPAAYASLLTYLDIDRASPTYFSATKNDTERLEKLFELYTKLTGAKSKAN